MSASQVEYLKNSVYVTSPYLADKERLKSLFGKFGKIRAVQHLQKFAFIEFADAASAEAAINACSQSHLLREQWLLLLLFLTTSRF